MGAIIERQGFAERQPLEHLFGSIKEQLGPEHDASERQLARLDTDQLYFTAVLEKERIAVDQFDGGRGFTALKHFNNCLRLLR